MGEMLIEKSAKLYDCLLKKNIDNYWYDQLMKFLGEMRQLQVDLRKLDEERIEILA